MGRPAKILAWLVAAVIAIFAIAAIALTLFFDPNDFREEIATAVHDETGRDLQIDGEISVKLFPWLAVEVGHAVLGNAEGFGEEPFAEFDRAHLSVRIVPLILSQEAKIGTAEIDGLRLNLQANGSGRTNWDDLLESGGDEAAAEAGGSGKAALEVSGVGINNATITYADQQTGDRYELTDVNFKLGRISSDAGPIPGTGSLHFDVQPAGYSGDVELDTTVVFDLDTGVITLDGFTVEGDLDGLVDAPTRMSFDTASMEIRSAESMVSMEPVTFSVLDIDMSAEVEPFSYADVIEPVAQIRVEPFSPRSLMHLFEVRLRKPRTRTHSRA